jgi:hypothetical protein
MDGGIWGEEVEPRPESETDAKIRAIFDRVLRERIETMLAQHRPPDATLQ